MRIAVLGAGVVGLTAAYRLTQAAHEVDVYERWPGLGGQAATLDVGDGLLLERYYHHLFTSDRHIADLCSELGVELEAWPSSIAMLADGRLHAFTSPLDLLRYRPLAPWNRVRLGLGVLRASRSDSVGPYEEITARRWVEQSMGTQVWERVWGPLMRAKFADRAEEVSASWLWAKLRSRRQVSGKEAAKEVLVYPRGSFEPIFVRLREEIERAEGRVLIDRPAARVGRTEGQLSVFAGEEGSFRRGHDPAAFEAASTPERYDTVLATVPTDVFAALLEPELEAELEPGFLDRAKSIPYYQALCLLLELDRRFHPFYWTNIVDADVPFIGLIEQTNLVPPERYGGRRFLYVANYLPPGDELLHLGPDELLERYEPALCRVNPAFRRDWVRSVWRFVEPAAQPVVLPGYRRRMPAYATGAPGLFLANTTQVYPEDRGTNYAVREGEQIAELVLSTDQRAPSAV